MCFNPKMPISMWTTSGILNQAHLFDPNSKSKPFMPRCYFCTESPGCWAAHGCCHQVPETGGHLPVSAATNWTSWTWKHRSPASPPWAVGWAGHGSLEGFFIIWFLFYYLISSRLWNDEAFSSGWCLLGLTGAVLPCSLTGEVAEFSTWGCVVHDLKDRKEGELGYFQVCWPHSVANEGN